MTRQVPENLETKTGTISSTAKSLADLLFDSDNLAVANRLVLSVTTDAVRWRKDGTAPTASVGHYLAPDSDPLVIEGNADVNAFQFIRVTLDAPYILEIEK